MIRILLPALLLIAVSAYGAHPRDELKGVRQEISAKKRQISDARKKEVAVSSELREINQSLEQKAADLGRLDRDLKGVEQSLGRTGHEIGRVSEEADRKKREIERRLVSLYKAGELGAVRMFFSAESFPQMAENMRYMQAILANDRKIFTEYSQKVEELRTLKGSLERDAARKERIKEGISAKKLEIELKQKEKAAYLQKVRTDRAGFVKSLKDLQANAARLQGMIDALTRPLPSRHEKPGRKLKPVPDLPPVPDRGFASQKGRMSMPVRGQIVETFGQHSNPSFPGTVTNSKGLSIAAAEGSDVRAIYEGTVIFADSFKGYGNMMIIDHGGGYFSLYAHAGRLMRKVGAEVKRSESVATVGDADTGKGPMLYFEIRHHGKAVDPAAWVR